MRAPTVLALFAAALCAGVSAHADPGPEASIPGPSDTAAVPQKTSTDSADHGRGTSDTNPVQGADGVPVTPPDTASVPPHGQVSSPVASDTTKAASTPSGPPEGYHGHRMPIPVVAKPDTVVSVPVPVPAAGEIDTEIDEDKALEIKLKTDPEAARRYRSPRKAFFLSLLVPGAGQIYCGSWIKATFFVATEVSLGVGWYEVAIVQAREKERQAEQYAALHWRQQRYDSTWVRLYQSGQLTATQIQSTAPNRQSLCDAIYGPSTGNPNVDNPRGACLDTSSAHADYTNYSKQFSVGGTTSAPPNWSQDSVTAFRSHNIKDLTAFYNVIGTQDLATGWEDNPDEMTVSDIQAYAKALDDRATNPSALVTNPWGVSAMQNYYLGLRSRSDQLARMQKWFLGGMILNHLAAAFDAALQAGRMNRELLQLQTTWLDGLDVQGGLAWTSTIPAMQARVDWSF